MTPATTPKTVQKLNSLRNEELSLLKNVRNSSKIALSILIMPAMGGDVLIRVFTSSQNSLKTACMQEHYLDFRLLGKGKYV